MGVWPGGGLASFHASEALAIRSSNAVGFCGFGGGWGSRAAGIVAAGGGMAATNAPAAAPVQALAPAPAPTPFPEGAVIRSKRDGKSYRIVNGQPTLVGP